MNQIDRLKENDLGFYALSVEDQDFIRVIIKENPASIIYRMETGWASKDNDALWLADVYRIHKDYQPEPNKPVFEGYELCEVKFDYFGNSERHFRFQRDDNWYVLDFAPRYGCCGYVFKERLEEMRDSPMGWVSEHGVFTAYHRNEGDFKPATLGWVCFRSGK